MSFMDPGMNHGPMGGHAGQGSAGVTDAVTALQGIVRQMSAWVQAFSGRMVFGTFTLGAAASTVVTNSAVQSNSYISYTPTNAAAATLMSTSEALYTSAQSHGVSFTVTTADGGAAAGTETFSYIIINP